MDGDLMQEFLAGKSFSAYEYFGVHSMEQNGTAGYIFRVYAPNAARVELMGEFSNWIRFDMNRDKYGVYSVFCADALPGHIYKYVITDKRGRSVEKSDPYGVYMEIPPASGSVVYDIDSYNFHDEKWISDRSRLYDLPMNVYELHLGSWRTKKDNPEQGQLSEVFSYDELIKRLIPYLKENGFTHVELMPPAEHPFYGSWGYQCSGFFSASSRYGSPDGLMRLIDSCHRNNIGVIADFVPVHFAGDSSYLHLFDGTPLYEYDSIDAMYNQWGSCNFCHSKPAAASFLLSAANFWIDKFHADGLRMDAISNMIYWSGDSKRGVNGGAVEVLKRLNDGLHDRWGNILLMAEDSTDYLKVTAPVKYDGLGFDYKWDMGFMNDTLNYFKTPPAERPNNYGMILFSMEYFYNELFILSFSHDEVVHGKATIIQKMWGDYDVKFPQCRTLYMYMFAHPGKKLNFMGNETAQFREWDETRQLDWELLKYPLHDSFHRFFRDLSLVYRYNPALYIGEYNMASFEWLENSAYEECVYAFRRTAGGQSVIFVMNTSDRRYDSFRIAVGDRVRLREIINSDSYIYSGSGFVNEGVITSEDIPHKGKEHSFTCKLAPFGSVLFEVCE